MTDAEGGNDDGSNRRLLDENGRLFGLVNVVDALVVLLVLAVVVAGLALLFPSAGEPDTRYVTLDLGEQPHYIAEQVSPGDEWDPEGTSDSVTITDVDRYGTESGAIVLVRAAVNGTYIEPDDPDDDPVFEFRGDPLRIGQSLELVTRDYQVAGDVTAVERSGDELPGTRTTQTVTVELENVKPSIANALSAGMTEETIDGTAAEVLDVTTEPAIVILTTDDGDIVEREHPRNRDVELTVELSVRELDDGTVSFRGEPLRIGHTVTLNLNHLTVTGEVTEFD